MFFGIDGQVFDCRSEECEAHRDDHECYGEFGPLRHEVMADVRLEARERDIQPVRDKPEHGEDRRQIQPLR